jgi:hypothetical protein
MLRSPSLLLLTLGLGVPGLIAAAEGESYSRVAEDLRAANEARGRRGVEVQAWREESERLAAASDGLQAELTRAQTELAAAESFRDGLRGEHQRLGAGEVAAAQVVLVEAAVTTRTRLQTLAASLPPGAIAVPSDDSLEAVLKALEASFKLADSVGVEVAAGHLAGDPAERRTAIRVLRAGPLAWWLALDGRTGGTAQVVTTTLELTAVDGAGVERIRHAIAMAEGRQASEPIALPRHEDSVGQ